MTIWHDPDDDDDRSGAIVCGLGIIAVYVILFVLARVIL